jgi:hypothetical protein
MDACILSTSLAGQAVGVKEVADGILAGEFYELRSWHIDLEEKPCSPGEPLRAESVGGLKRPTDYECR